MKSNPIREKLKYINYKILIPYLILTITGIIMIYSASSELLLINGFKPSIYGVRQAIYAIVAFILGAMVYFIPIRILRNPKLLACLVTLGTVLLLFVRFFGQEVNGARGWINLGFFNLQPLELCKLILILYLAHVLDRVDGKLTVGNIRKNLLYPSVIAAIFMALVLIEPDIGGTAILFLIVLIMYSVSGVPAGLAITWIVSIILIVVGVFCLLVQWNPSFLSNKYFFKRFVAFLNPFKNAQGVGAQLVNSYYAIHNGGLIGVGLGNSMEKRGYLPEPYTDFILSVISEEVGSIGAIIILGVLFYLMIQIMQVGIKADAQYTALVCFGIVTVLFSETFFNVGALLGLLPITGVTLPFISYGGSSILVLTICIAVVLNVSASESWLKAERAK